MWLKKAPGDLHSDKPLHPPLSYFAWKVVSIKYGSTLVPLSYFALNGWFRSNMDPVLFTEIQFNWELNLRSGSNTATERGCSSQCKYFKQKSSMDIIQLDKPNHSGNQRLWGNLLVMQTNFRFQVSDFRQFCYLLYPKTEIQKPLF